MRISLHWLNEYLDRPIDADGADRLLTAAGFPIDGREVHGDDIALEVEVTSNRPDCLSHIGVAREIAAASDRSLKLPPITPHSTGPAIASLTSITLDAPDLCPTYIARVIKGVRIAPSPPWLIRHLQSIGLRPVNNVVDVTNFVLHEMGQPLHAFDMNKLDGRRIVVRRAIAGEPFTAIDGSKHTLRPDMLVIADARRPVAIAGVMGGAESEVDESTTDILLESARFAPLSIRTTSRALKLSSDSSYRFERGVDPAGLDRASQRASHLICEIAGGSLAEGAISAGAPLPQRLRVTMDIDRCCSLLGYTPSVELMLKKLAALELAPVLEGKRITCTIPHHRLDLSREADLIEEVARTAGYNAIPQHERMQLVIRPPQPLVLVRREVGRLLVAHGYYETITFSNIAQRDAQPFVDPAQALITLEDERAAQPALRPSLLPSLLAVRKTNQDAGNHDVRLFEIARVFASVGGEYVEHRHLALLADASTDQALRELKGTIEELLAKLGVEAQFTAADPLPPWAIAAGEIRCGEGRLIGQFGRAAPAVLKQSGLKTQVALAWLDYDEITAAYPPPVRLTPLARFPGIERDLSILVDEAVAWSSVEAAIGRTGPALLDEVQFIGTYRGKQIGADRKSVSFRLKFSDPNKTLRHEEVDPQVQAVVEALRQAVGAELRSV